MIDKNLEQKERAFVDAGLKAKTKKRLCLGLALLLLLMAGLLPSCSSGGTRVVPAESTANSPTTGAFVSPPSTAAETPTVSKLPQTGAQHESGYTSAAPVTATAATRAVFLTIPVNFSEPGENEIMLLPADEIPQEGGVEVPFTVEESAQPTPAAGTSPETTETPQVGGSWPGVTILNSGGAPWQENIYSWLQSCELPVLIDYSSEGCRPCQQAAPVIQKIAQEYEGRVIVVSINLSVAGAPKAGDIQFTPTFTVYYKGFERGGSVGYKGNPAELYGLAELALNH